MKFAKVVLSAVMMMSVVSVAKAGDTPKCAHRLQSSTTLLSATAVPMQASTSGSSDVTTKVHGNGAVR